MTHLNILHAVQQSVVYITIQAQVSRVGCSSMLGQHNPAVGPAPTAEAAQALSPPSPNQVSAVDVSLSKTQNQLEEEVAELESHAEVNLSSGNQEPAREKEFTKWFWGHFCSIT